MGLPGSGKTTFAKELKTQLELKGISVAWYNADDVRHTFNDWDFSYEGRLRQAKRMRSLADLCETDFVLCDFVAPIHKMRDEFNPDVFIWMDTVDHSQYKDTDKLFEPPITYTIRITEKNAAELVPQVIKQHFTSD